MRRVVRPQYLGRMRIERHDQRRAVGRLCVRRGSGNDRLMAEMNAVEDPDGQKERTGQLAEFGDGIECFQKRNDE